jgi:4-amino-4-deoxy-L-arabinose transferase-like glycosyltransferase
MNEIKNYYPVLVLLLLCTLLYVVGIDSISITDPDEAFYAETAREMLSHHSCLTPLIFEKPQFEKPPLFYWLLMLSFKFFGISTFSVRLVPAFFGIIGVLGTYLFMKKIIDERISFYSSLILATNFLVFVSSRMALTDIVFSVFVAFSLYSFYIWHKLKRNNYLIAFAIFSSLAVLTKGPLGILIPVLAAILFLILTRDSDSLKDFVFNKWWLVFLGISLPWYIYASLRFGKEFLWEFFVHDHWHRILYAEHKNFDKWYFYPSVILTGMFPWTFYFLLSGANFKRYKNIYLFLFSWIAVVFSVFSPAHSKLASYIVPLAPALAVILGISLASLEGKYKRTVLTGVLDIILGIGLFFSLGFLKRDYPDLYLQGFIVSGVFSCFLIIAGIFLILNKSKPAIILKVSGFTLFILIADLVMPNKLETAFTNRDLVKIVSEYNYVNQPIVCDKMYVRGAYFYTRNPVVVMDGNKNPFWSKHPIEVLSMDEEIFNFFKDRNKVICVIKKGDLERLNRIFSDKRENKIISSSLDRLVVLSQKSHP